MLKKHTLFLVFFLFLQIQFFSLIIPQTLKFKHLTVKEGLSNNKVNTLIQDKNGFIWLGTEDGLNRYDGYSFKVFRNIPDDSASLSDNSIWSLYEDNEGHILVGTKAGILNEYDPILGKFSRIKFQSFNQTENSIKTLYEDRKGNIWIGTYKEGLYKFDRKTNKVEHWVRDKNNSKSLSHNYILSILEDINGKIIIGTYNGLSVLDPEKPQNEFKTYYHIGNNHKNLSSNLIWQLTQSPIDSNIIWISTHNHLTKLNVENYSFERIEIPNPDDLQYGTSTGYIIDEINDGQRILWSSSYSGLVKINLTTNSVSRFTHEDNNSNSIISNQLNKILRDSSRVLWIATENGVSYSTEKSSLFNSEEINNKISFLKEVNVTAISKIDNDEIILGTMNGLYTLENLTTSPSINKISPLNNYHIWSLASTGKNEIWAGTYGKGLKQINTQNGNIINWDLHNSKTNSEALFYNKSLLRDKNGFIWIGFWGVGAAKLNSETGEYKIWLDEQGNKKSISHNDVWTIEEDSFGRIWLGTQGGGLNLFEDKNGGIFHHWLENENSSNSISSNSIFCITEAKSNVKNNETILWIGTNNGLNKLTITNKSDSSIYDFETNFQFYSIGDGLSNNLINSIIVEENGNLWLGTGSGITLFDIENEKFTNFTSEDGIIGTSMNPDAAIKLRNYIIMGSKEGLNIFDPGKISQSNFKPNLIFTDFKLFNKSAVIGKNSLLKKSLISTKKIELDNDQDVFSIEFTALDYNSPKSIEYAYKMEGFDQDWVESGNRRLATYTNLDPGNYTFKVKSTNADGIWTNNEASLNIFINPPWWKTIWANTAFVILILTGLYAIRRFELNRTMLRNELRLKEFEVKQKSELEEIKSRFFANLSHEFRTPLMLIKGPLENLKNKFGIHSEENFNLIERNSKRLEHLIDQLLELSQLEKAAIPLKAGKENIVVILKGLISSFESLAIQKNITLQFENNLISELFWLDKDKFEKIINNLLSNAFKFTPDHGKVSVSISEKSKNNSAELIISDSGISIPHEKLDKIFDRFYQVDDTLKRTYGGSGIGLALVKEFVDLHKWEIYVKSEKEQGTEFIIEIPYGDDHLNRDEKISSGENLIVQKISQEKLYKDPEKGLELNSELINGNKSILIVDDSKDVRKYLKNLLSEEYSIFEAENGENGIKKAAEILPDLIISDVMMPSMNGIEFCSKIKSEWLTSDIPIILLTAKASFESKIEGLEIGADEYLTKPFDTRELFTRIKNLIAQRERLRNKYVNEIEAKFDKSKYSSADQEFIEKIVSSIEKNIDKTNFSTEFLANELLMSRTKLHRKVQQITGQAPGEFIRNFKLKKAANLLLENKLTVTQIAYEIGFSSPAQFTRAFSKQYNCVPSEYFTKQKA